MLSLLIVDDDSQMRSLIRSIVADLADSIIECSEGAAAVACYAEHHPDWVLMDLMMPRVGGLAATCQIVAFDPAARIVVVTRHESQGLREAARRAGACAYVSKDNLLDLREILTAAG